MTHTHIIVKEVKGQMGRPHAELPVDINFTKMDNSCDVIELVSEISKGDSVKIKHIFRIDMHGNVTPMHIEFKDGKLQLTELPKPKSPFDDVKCYHDTL